MFDWYHANRLENAVTAAAGAPGPARGAPSGAPNRPGRHWAGRSAALALLAATLGLLLFLGWVLIRGASDLTEDAMATDLGLDACGPTSCAITWAEVDLLPRAPLPREWRWESKAVDLDHMYRE